jgi:hypothetical protein
MISRRLTAAGGVIGIILVVACSLGHAQSAGAPATGTAQPAATPALPPGTASATEATPSVPPGTPSPAQVGSLNLVAAANGGRVVSVSDELDEYPASHLIDGDKLDYGEWWTSEPPKFPQVVVFAFAGDQVKTINRVVLNPWTSEWRYAWVKDFQIYASATSPKLEDMGWVGSFTLEHVGIDQEFTFDPVRAKYVALVVTSHYGSAEGITLNEFEVYEAPADAVPVELVRLSHIGNLAAASHGGRIVKVSSEDATGDWSAEHLIDGRKDTETGWSSSDNLDERQYVVFGFPGDKSYVVDRVVLNPYSKKYEEDWIHEFEVWGSDSTLDMDSMEKLGSFELEQSGEDQTFTFDPVKLRYIALVPISNYGGTEFALNEFEVYEVGSTISARALKKQAASLSKDAASPGKKVELPPESPPKLATILTDFLPRSLAASQASPLENIEFEVKNSDLVPVIYHLYGKYFDSLVITTLTNRNAEPVKVRVESSIPSYTQAAVDTLTLAPGETAEVDQNPPLTPAALDMLHGMKGVDVHVQIDYLKEGEKRLIYEGTAPVTIYSRDDFPWNIPGYHNGTIFLATMVMPNDPSLDELMRVAADNMPSGTITIGYGDEEDSDHSVWDRMKAIYDAVADHYNVTYVATGTDFVPKEEKEQGFTLQRLKLPYEVLESHSGMCVEVSTLFASAFEKIGLRTIIITVPGHVYVAVPISWDSTTYYFLEGTLVGRASFEEAVQVGNEEFMDKALQPIEEDRLDQYFWLDVSEARQEGIWPIPWR